MFLHPFGNIIAFIGSKTQTETFQDLRLEIQQLQTKNVSITVMEMMTKSMLEMYVCKDKLSAYASVPKLYPTRTVVP